MTTIVSSDWVQDINGVYATGSDWTTNTVPTFSGGFEYDIFIGGSATQGTASFTVTSSANEQLGFVQIGANATLSISAGVFLVKSHVNWYSNIYNYGAIAVGASATLAFGAAADPSTDSTSLSNVGAVTVAGTLDLLDSWFGLYDSGTLTLSGRIIGAHTGSAATLQNNGSTILGSGSIGNGAGLQLTNAFGGLIDANAAAAMTINTGTNTIENAATIETTGAGGLTIASNIQNDGQLIAGGKGVLRLIGAGVGGGGDVTVDAHASLSLNNGQISQGGSITVATAGALATTAGNTTGIGSNNVFVGDVLQAGDIEDDGSIAVADDSTLNLNATTYGVGVISLAGGTSATKLEIFNSGVTIWNTGGVVMSNSSHNAIVSNGAGIVLSVNTKLSGAGTVGDGWLRLVNHLGGVITANDSTALVILADTSAVSAGTETENYNDGTMLNTGTGGLTLSGGTLGNAGYLEEKGAGALTLAGASIDSGGGIVMATTGSIVLQGNAHISNQAYVSIGAGATLTTTSGDASDAIFGFTLVAGTVDVVANSTLDLTSHWNISGVMDVGAATGGATLALQANAIWQTQGVGELDLLNAADKIVSLGASATFQDRMRLIRGGGTLGDANMTINIMNGATIDATLAGGMTLTGASLYNDGTLQSDSAGGLTIATVIDSPGHLVADAGAKILAEGAVYGPGQTTINGTGSVEFAAESDGDVYFAGSGGGSLILDASHSFYGDIFGLAAGDSIDLRDFAFVSGSTGMDATTSAFGALDGTLYVNNGSGDSAPIYLQGDYTSATLAAEHLAFQFVSDGHLIGSSGADGTLVKLVSTA